MSSRTPQHEDAAPPQIPGYELLERIGLGGQGAIYRARQRSLDRIVAVKVVRTRTEADAAAVKRFLREARTVSKLHHPNILQAIDAGAQDGLRYFVMEFVAGCDARAVLDQRGRLDVAEVLGIGHQVGQAIHYASRRGVLHRDIKPENLMVADDGMVKVVDFGMVQLAHDEPGRRAGTRGYVAPELLRGRGRADVRSDLFSLGVTLFELLSGSTPKWPRNDPAAGPDFDKQLPATGGRVREVLARLLAFDPARRFQSAREFLDAVAELPEFGPIQPLATVPETDAAVPGASGVPAWWRRGAIAGVGGGVLALVALAVLVLASRKQPGEPSPPAQPSRVADREKSAEPAARKPTRPEETKPRTPAAAPTRPAAPIRPVAPPPPAAEPAAVEQTSPPKLVFEPVESVVNEGDEVVIRLRAANLGVAFAPVVKLLDESGKVSGPDHGRLVVSPVLDRPHEVEIHWRAPCRQGHTAIIWKVVAYQGVLQKSHSIVVHDTNRPPTLRLRGKSERIVEEGKSAVLHFDVADADGDKVTLEVEKRCKNFDVVARGRSATLSVPDRPGVQAGAFELVIVARDARGAKTRARATIRVKDIDHPTRVSASPRAPWIRIGKPDNEEIVFAGTRATNLSATLRLQDPDRPELAAPGISPAGKWPTGLKLEARESGEQLLSYRARSNACFGPVIARIRIRDGERDFHRTIRLQVMRRLEPPERDGDALDRAFGWLRRHQLTNGALPVSASEMKRACRDHSGECGGAGYGYFEPGITAIAAIAALRSGDGSPWVRKMLYHLLMVQTANGWFTAGNGYTAYNHMLATEAMVLGYHLLGDARYRVSARKALALVVRMRNYTSEGGAWRYGIRPGNNDTSMTLWAMRALLAGRMAGFDIPPGALHDGFNWIRSRTDASGRIGYETKGSPTSRMEADQKRFPAALSEAMTAGGLSVLLQEVSDAEPSPALLKGVRLVVTCWPAWELTRRSALIERLERLDRNKPGAFSPVDFYYWQNGTYLFRVLHNVSRAPRLPPTWHRFERFVEGGQRRRGPARGSIDPTGVWCKFGGRSYATAITALALVNCKFPQPMVGEFAR